MQFECNTQSTILGIYHLQHIHCNSKLISSVQHDFVWSKANLCFWITDLQKRSKNHFLQMEPVVTAESEVNVGNSRGRP